MAKVIGHCRPFMFFFIEDINAIEMTAQWIVSFVKYSERFFLHASDVWMSDVKEGMKWENMLGI